VIPLEITTFLIF